VSSKFHRSHREGELFANIIGDGFSRSKKGDRFYFESSQSGLTAGMLIYGTIIFNPKFVDRAI